MKLAKALAKYTEVRVFRVEDSDDVEANWDVEPADSPVLVETENLFIVKAKNVLPDGTIQDCYIDLSLPERINDNTYYFDGKSIEVIPSYEVKGDVICAVPIDCFGAYELFYSKNNPDLGIEILREGLLISEHKSCIAEDLGYILRDEGRFKEAAEMFQIAVDETPSSYFIYGELAACYEEIGEAIKAEKYKAIFAQEDKTG